MVPGFAALLSDNMGGLPSDSGGRSDSTDPGVRAILRPMARTVHLEIPMPGNLQKFQLPAGVQRRLADLLDRQDKGIPLTAAERREAEGLVEMSEMLTFLKLRSGRKSKIAA